MLAYPRSASLPTPAEEERVREGDELLVVGKLTGVIEGMAVVQADGRAPPMGEGTVMCLHGMRKEVGRVEVSVDEGRVPSELGRGG